MAEMNTEICLWTLFFTLSLLFAEGTLKPWCLWRVLVDSIEQAMEIHWGSAFIGATKIWSSENELSSYPEASREEDIAASY